MPTLPSPPPVSFDERWRGWQLCVKGPQLEPLLNLEQAGQLLGLNRKQMFELTRERSQSRRKVRLPVVKIGKRCLFRREALQQWITELEKGA